MRATPRRRDDGYRRRHPDLLPPQRRRGCISVDAGLSDDARADSKRTGGALTVVEELADRATTPPLHRHVDSDEASVQSLLRRGHVPEETVVLARHHGQLRKK
jgi:hypothetical protein